MKKFLASALALVFTFSCAAFAHTGKLVNSGGHRYKAVALTPEVYNNANTDLSDLRIVNQNGENTPYFVNSYYQSETSGEEITLLRELDAYVKDDDFYFDFEAYGASGDIIATSVRFATDSASFAKTVEVLGSHDNRHWESVTRDTVYNVDGLSKTEIVFGAPLKYGYYRFRLNNNLERINLTEAWLIYSSSGVERDYFLSELSPAFRTEERDGQTLLTLSGMKNLRLQEVEIEADGMFKRSVTAPNATEYEIYSLSFGGQTYRDTTVSFNGAAAGDELTLTIDNHDDRPITITGVRARYYYDELVFEWADGEYALEFGADETKTAPVYDIALYREQVLAEGTDRITLDEIAYEAPAAPAPAGLDYKLLFNVVIAAVSVLLGVVIIISLKKR